MSQRSSACYRCSPSSKLRSNSRQIWISDVRSPSNIHTHLTFVIVSHLPENWEWCFEFFEFSRRWLWGVLVDGNELRWRRMLLSKLCSLKHQVIPKGKQFVIPSRKFENRNILHGVLDAINWKRLIGMLFILMCLTLDGIVPDVQLI